MAIQRSTFVDSKKVADAAQTIPSVSPGSGYYRILTEYEPMPAQGEAGDPIAGLWVSLFGNAVAEAGDVSVKLRLSHPGPLGLPHPMMMATCYLIKVQVSRLTARRLRS